MLIARAAAVQDLYHIHGHIHLDLHFFLSLSLSLSASFALTPFSMSVSSSYFLLFSFSCLMSLSPALLRTITLPLSLKGDCILAEIKSPLEFPHPTIVGVRAIYRLVVRQCSKVISWIFLQRERLCLGCSLIKAGPALERPPAARLSTTPSLTSNWMGCGEMATSTWPGAPQSTSLP